MRKVIKNKAFIIFVIHFIFIFILVISKFNLTNVSILKDEFIIPIELSILGLLLTIFTLLYALMDKIIQTFKNLDIHTNNIYISLKEFGENTKFIFYVLVIMFLLSALDSCDIPIIKQGNFLNKHLFIYDIKLILISLTFIATHDSIMTLFSFLNLWKKIQ